MGFLVIFDWIMLILIYTTYKNSNFMEGQNMFCRLWVQTMMIGLIIDPLWILLKIKMEAV